MNTFNITARNRQNKNGLLPLYFVATLNRKSVYKSLGVCVPVNFWDAKNQCIKQINSEALHLSNIKAKATAIVLKLHLENKIVDQDQFIDMVFENNHIKNGTDFYLFFETFLNNANYPPTHVKAYNTLKEQLMSFNKNVCFNQINYSFCIGFANYLKTEFKNCNNTRLKKIQYLRCILNEAQKHGLIKVNAAKDVTIKTEKTNRHALSKVELTVLEQLYNKNILKESSQNVLKYFLFCCYTGLRFGDLVKFRNTDINGGVIKIVQNKTGAVVSIPLIPKAKALVPDFKFKVLTNQKSNEHLKYIKEVAEIKTHISCHVARHTFATIGLNCGIPLEVVSEVLGHSSTRVTKIYAKMLDEFKIKQFEKFI